MRMKTNGWFKFSLAVILLSLKLQFLEAYKGDNVPKRLKDKDDLWRVHHAINMFSSGIFDEIPRAIEAFSQEKNLGAFIDQKGKFLQEKEKVNFFNKIKKFSKRVSNSNPFIKQALEIAKPLAQSLLASTIKDSLEMVERMSAEAVDKHVPQEFKHALVPAINHLWNKFENKLGVDISDNMFQKILDKAPTPFSSAQPTNGGISSNSLNSPAEAISEKQDENEAAKAGMRDSPQEVKDEWSDILADLGV